MNQSLVAKRLKPNLLKKIEYDLIIDEIAEPDFDMKFRDISVPMIKYFTHMVRMSYEYFMIIQFMKNFLDISRCAYYEGYNMKNGFSIEMHHAPLTLFDYCQIVANKQFAENKGYVETLLKRRRYLPDINSTNAIVRGYAERNAINAPIQGSAADIIKLAMINVQKAIESKGLKSKMILQVHDELVFDVLKKEQVELESLVKENMENALDLSVPLDIEYKVADNWLEAH